MECRCLLRGIPTGCEVTFMGITMIISPKLQAPKGWEPFEPWSVHIHKGAVIHCISILGSNGYLTDANTNIFDMSSMALVLTRREVHTLCRHLCWL